MGLKHLLGVRDAYYYEKKGNNCLQKGEYGQAVQFYSQSLAADPIYPQVYYELRGRAYMAKGAHKEALADYAAAIRNGSPSSYMPPRIRGDIAFSASNLNEAIREYMESIDLHSDTWDKESRQQKAETYNNLALALLDRGDAKSAIANLTNAVDLFPDCIPLWQNRARAHRLNGDVVSAARDEEKAKALGVRHSSNCDDIDWSAVGGVLVKTGIVAAKVSVGILMVAGAILLVCTTGPSPCRYCGYEKRGYVCGHCGRE